MIDEETISDTLEAMSNRRHAKLRGRDVQPLRGVRGVPDGEVARIASAIWSEGPIDLDEDHGALDRLFQQAFEDGLLAIGLAAAATPDAPEAGLDLGLTWLTRIDDPLTADALGAALLGPALLASGRPVARLLQASQQASHPAARRAVVSAALAMLPEPLQGPAAAPLRARLGVKSVQFVDTALSDGVAAILDHAWRDEDPSVRKAVRRVLRVWAKADPAGAVAWGDGLKGGLPKLLRPEIDKARRRAERSP